MRAGRERWAALGLAWLAAAGCGPVGRPADAPPVLALSHEPRVAEPATLTVRLAPIGRRLLALPAAWEIAVLRLSHPVVLQVDRTRTLARDVDLLANGSGGYDGVASLGGALRPAAGYTLDVALWQGAVETGALVAVKSLPLVLAGGLNAVTVTLDVLADPLALTGFAPAAAAWGETVALAGSGFDPLVANDQATLGGVAADVTAAASTSLDAAVPPLAPGTYDWHVMVGGHAVRRPGFVVEAPPLGAPLRASLTTSQQRDPAVVAAGADFLPVWVDDRLAVKDDLVARPVEPDGDLPGPDAIVTAADSTFQARPHVAYDAGRGRALVVWQDGVGTPDVLARFVDATGAPLTATFAVAADPGAQSRPRLAYDVAADAYLVAYRDGSDVVARRVAGDGSAVGAALPIATGPGIATLMDVACSPAAGRYLVVWGGSSQSVNGQLVDASGALVGAPLDIAVGAPEAQVQPAVATSGATGDFLVAWVAQATLPEVRARRVAVATGALGPTAVISQAAAATANPRLAWVPWHARFLVAWQATGVDDDVFGAYVTGDGATWGLPFAIADGPGAQSLPEVAAQPGAARSLVVYEQHLGADRLVHGERVR